MVCLNNKEIQGKKIIFKKGQAHERLVEYDYEKDVIVINTGSFLWSPIGNYEFKGGLDSSRVSLLIGLFDIIHNNGSVTSNIHPFYTFVDKSFEALDALRKEKMEQDALEKEKTEKQKAIEHAKREDIERELEQIPTLRDKHARVLSKLKDDDDVAYQDLGYHVRCPECHTITPNNVEIINIYDDSKIQSKGLMGNKKDLNGDLLQKIKLYHWTSENIFNGCRDEFLNVMRWVRSDDYDGDDIMPPYICWEANKSNQPRSGMIMNDLKSYRTVLTKYWARQDETQSNYYLDIIKRDMKRVLELTNDLSKIKVIFSIHDDSQDDVIKDIIDNITGKKQVESMVADLRRLSHNELRQKYTNVTNALCNRCWKDKRIFNEIICHEFPNMKKDKVRRIIDKEMKDD